MLLKMLNELKYLANPKKAKILSGFFKTGAGEYGEGDIFLGIPVPHSRKIAKKYASLDPDSIIQLLKSKIHEHRLIALLILVEQYRNARNEENKKEIFDLYLTNSEKVNNWDLVDLSADKIVGEHLFNKDKSLLSALAKSKNLWQRRIAIISTFNFIKKGKFAETLKIAKILMKEKHDLIQKAVGWMLREIGKRNQQTEEQFLDKHYKNMPRTTLRYAIEKFNDDKRKFYMLKNATAIRAVLKEKRE